MFFDPPFDPNRGNAYAGEPASYGEYAEAVLETQRRARNYNAIDLYVERGYADDIDKIKSAAGIELENPHILYGRRQQARSIMRGRSGDPFGIEDGWLDNYSDPYERYAQEIDRNADKLRSAGLDPDALKYRPLMEAQRRAKQAKMEEDRVSQSIGPWWRPDILGVGLASSFYGQLDSPIDTAINLGFGVAGSARQSLIRNMMKNAAANAAAQAALEPTIQANQQWLGIESSWQEAVANIGMAFLLGGSLDLIGRAPIRAARALRGDQGLGGIFRDAIPVIPQASGPAPIIDPDVLAKAYAGDPEAFGRLAEITGTADDDLVKGYKLYAETGGVQDAALMQAMDKLGIDVGERERLLLGFVRSFNGEPPPRIPDPIPEARSPSLAEDQSGLVQRAGSNQFEGKTEIDGRPAATRTLSKEVVAQAARIDALEDRISDRVIAFERQDGTLVLNGKPNPDGTPAIVLREADGWIEADARKIGMRQVLQDGYDNPVEIARQIRTTPDLIDSSVPITEPVSAARAIAKLSDRAFAMVERGEANLETARLIGETQIDPQHHADLLERLMREAPDDMDAARQVLADHAPQDTVAAMSTIAGVDPSDIDMSPVKNIDNPKVQTERLTEQLAEDIAAAEQPIVLKRELESKVETIRGEIAKLENQRLGGMESAAPSFEDVYARMPRDDAGFPDVSALQARIKEMGVTSWAELDDARRISLAQEFAPDAPKGRVAADQLPQLRSDLRETMRQLARVNRDLDHLRNGTRPGIMEDMVDYVLERAAVRRQLEARRAIADAIKFARTMLGDGQRIDVVPALRTADGIELDAWANTRTGDIVLALKALDPTAKLSHEAVHVLITRGVLSPAEMRLLAAAGRKAAVMKPEIEAQYRDQYAGRANLDTLIDEEMAAHFIDASVAGKLTPEPEPATIVGRVKRFFDRMGERLQNAREGAGFQTVDELRDAILNGEVARRQAIRDWMRVNDVSSMTVRGPGGFRTLAPEAEARGFVSEDVAAAALPGDQFMAAISDPGIMPDGDHADRISTRFPQQVQSTEDPISERLQINLDAMRVKPDAFAHNANIVRNYVTWPKANKARSPEKVFESAKELYKNNLIFLYNQVPDDIRNQSKLWYDGARHLTERWADDFDLPPRAIAGVLAALSPGKDWYANVSMGERLLDIFTNAKDHSWRREMSAVAREIVPEPLMSKIEGRTLGELILAGDGLSAGAWIRVYDQTYHDPKLRVVSPDGRFIGSPSQKINWQSYALIEKAVRVLMNPSYDVVSRAMGDAHKIRSFYNNILAPDSKHGDVTIDTHAIAAAQLRPLAQKSIEVAHGLGSGTEKGAINTKDVGQAGVKGLYGLYADAYREAANQIGGGLLPRELQSITWEAVRGLYPRAWKRAPNIKAIDDIWLEVKNGRIGYEDARARILDVAGGIENPSWHGRGGEVLADQPDSSYSGELSAARLSGRVRRELMAPAGTRGSRSRRSTPDGVMFAISDRVRDFFVPTTKVRGFHGAIGNRPPEGTFWASSSSDIAGSYAMPDGTGKAEGYSPSIAPVEFRFKNPLIVDGLGRSWEELQFNGERASTDYIAEVAKEQGHDGVIFRNVLDSLGDDATPQTTIAALRRGTTYSTISGDLMFAISDRDTGRSMRADMDAIDAGHVSAHDFDRFDTGKIGGGEGGQWFGFGHYFAASEKTLDVYEKAFTSHEPVLDGVAFENMKTWRRNTGVPDDESFIVDYDKLDASIALGKAKKEAIRNAVRRDATMLEGLHAYDEVDVLDEIYELMHVQSEGGRWIDAVKKRAREMTRDGDGEYGNIIDKALDFIIKWNNEGRITINEKKPIRYKVKLHVDKDRLVDLDSALLDQTPFVRNALSWMIGDRAVTGQTLWQRLFGRAPEVGPNGYKMIKDAISDKRNKDLSDRLKNVGIHGYRYKNGVTRGRFGEADPDAFNYVVFDDDHIQITHKDGTPVEQKERSQATKGLAQGGDGRHPFIKGEVMFAIRQDQDALGYRSAALEAARNLKQAKGTPEQMLAQLKSAGVKDAEIEATGLRAALDGKKAVTRDEIISHLERNRVRLEEVQNAPLTQGPMNRNSQYATRAVQRAIERAGDIDDVEMILANDGDAYRSLQQRHPDLMANDDWAEIVTQDLFPAGVSRDRAAKWSSHSLDPSNPTYRETVLHLPERPIKPSGMAGQAWGDDVVFTDVGSAGDPNFRAGHFDQPNIIGHMMTSMVKHEGKPAYLVDQIQSDWGQKLRDGGVRDEAKIAELKKQLEAAKKRADELDVWPLGDQYKKELASVVDKYGHRSNAPPDIIRRLDELDRSAYETRPDRASPEYQQVMSDIDRIEAEIATAEAATPGNPLVNTTDQWLNTTLRRAIRQAAEADAEYIAIPSGDTVLSYNPQGDAEGNAYFYGKIVPKNLRNLLRKLDKASPDPTFVKKIETSQGLQGWKGDDGRSSPGNGADPEKTGFTVFPLTGAVKRSVVQDGQVMFAFAGERAKTADLDALAKAKAMEADGVDRDVIWRETGWGRGTDRKWRFEIDDSGVRIIDGFANITHATVDDQNLVSGVVEGDTLKVANSIVGQKGRGQGTSLYHSLFNDAFARGLNVESDTSVSAEAQRVYEGLAERGYGVEENSNVRRLPSGELLSLGGGGVYTVRPHANKNHPEAVLARTMMARMSMTPEERRARPFWYDYDVPEDQQIVRFANGKSVSERSYSEEPPVPGPAMRGDVMFAIKAYHGSPHDFDRFDMSKINTGEGSQAFGHGLYFAQNEGVARSYRDALGGTDFGRALDMNVPADYAAYMLSQVGLGTPQSVERAIARLENIKANGLRLQPKNEEQRAQLANWVANQDAAIEHLRTGTQTPSTPKGRLYEVRINAEPEDFLDWDKPLSQQSEKVRKLAAEHQRRLTAEVRGMTDGESGDFWNELKGSDLVEILQRKAEGVRVYDDDALNSGRMPNSAKVTNLLAAQGIPGIRYLDQDSRTSGEGTHNFVVFDDSLVEIVAKDGRPVTAQERADVTQAMTPDDGAMFAIRQDQPQDPIGALARSWQDAVDAAQQAAERVQVERGDSGTVVAVTRGGRRYAVDRSADGRVAELRVTADATEQAQAAYAALLDAVTDRLPPDQIAAYADLLAALRSGDPLEIAQQAADVISAGMPLAQQLAGIRQSIVNAVGEPQATRLINAAIDTLPEPVRAPLSRLMQDARPKQQPANDNPPMQTGVDFDNPFQRDLADLARLDETAELLSVCKL